MLMLGGQAASGKSSARTTSMRRLGADGGVIADFDGLLAYHPAYAELLAEDDRRASILAGDDAFAWMNKLIDLAEEKRLNLLREGSMGGGAPERESLRFRRAGYRVEADVMAVGEAVSRVANLERYQAMREQSGHGRLVATGIHDRAYAGIPRTLEAVDSRKILDEVRLHRWGGGLVYGNALGPSGEWRDRPRSPAALRQERDRALTPAERDWIAAKLTHLAARLPPELLGQLPEIEAMARARGFRPGARCEGSAELQ